MTHADFAPIAMYAALIGHRYVAGAAHGAADARDRVGAVKMALLGLLLQGGLSSAAALLDAQVLPTWAFVVLTGLCAVSTIAPAFRQRDEIRLFTLTLGMLTIYAIVGGLVATPTMGVALLLAVLPGLLATASGWNKAAGFEWIGETGAPVPRVVEWLVWGAALSVLGFIVWMAYSAIT